jgi:hypothetical protein
MHDRAPLDASRAQSDESASQRLRRGNVFGDTC